ncbi:MAG: hypothetical protein R3257_01940 [bacterium]|nr:hypothetical protein [bacterium]
MKKLGILCLLLSLIATFGCAGVGIETVSNPPSNPSENGGPVGPDPKTTPESFVSALVTLNFFALGGDFPPNLVIPDIDGMRGTAFVISFFPTAVIPIDLDTGAVSTKFQLFDASAIPEAAFPNSLWIESPSRAYLLGFTHVVVFNPTTGTLLGTRSLTDPINLTQILPYSQPGDCDGNNIDESSVGPGPYSPSFPASVAVHSGRLFVTMSNACFDPSFESFYVQGILLVFDILDSAPYLTPASTPFLVLPGFNVTGLTATSDRLIATSTGDTSLQSGVAIPETDSFLTEIDPVDIKINRLLNLGLVAVNFQALAVNAPETLGFIGSSAFSEMYEIDLENFLALRGKDDPIVLFAGDDDFISDQEIAYGDQVLFASSFNHSGVKGVDLTDPNRMVLPNVLDFSFESNPGVTGAGPMALRPGQAGIDYSGPDLWVLTASPGTLSNARTY